MSYYENETTMMTIFRFAGMACVLFLYCSYADCTALLVAGGSTTVGALNNILQGVSAATRPEEEWISKHIISLDLQQQGRSCAYILEIA